MNRLRRRLLVWSAPAALLIVAAIVASTSVVIAHHSVASDIAAGNLAARDGRLDEAERRFSDAVRADSAQSCSARVNLELVRETLGDREVAAGDGPAAIDRYRAALSVVTDAPGGCFEANGDADAARRIIRVESRSRLEAKLALLERPLPPPPAATPPPSRPPAPPPLPPASGQREAPSEPDERRLNPRARDPLDSLRQLLEDGAAQRGAP